MLFREHGFDGIGLNDLMQAAGLTRGGFYGHFESKDDLAAQATRRALQANREQRKKQTGRSLQACVKTYLSDAHRDHISAGCGLVALAGDAARGGPAVPEVFAEGVARHARVCRQAAAERSLQRPRAAPQRWDGPTPCGMLAPHVNA